MCTALKELVVDDVVVMLLTANRQELDVSLLAEPSSDEDEELIAKRSKYRRRKPATARGADSKANIRLLPTVSCSDQAATADSTSQTANSKFIPPAKTRKRMKSLCYFLSCYFIMGFPVP